MLIHFLNGKFVSEEKLLISPRDLGFTRGYAVADFIVTYNNKLFYLEQHVDRLFKSAYIIGLNMPWSKQQIIDWAQETLSKNDTIIEKALKIIVSGGVSHSLHQAETPTLVMIVSLRNQKPVVEYENGIKTLAVEYKRQYPEAKHTHYIEAIRQLAKDTTDEIGEVIYYDKSQVFEGAGSNIFAVINNRLITPKSNIVEGITRNILLDILQLSIPIQIRDFTFEELLQATEIFLTGSNSEVRGVVQINSILVGDGKVGEITKDVARQYKEYIHKQVGKEV